MLKIYLKHFIYEKCIDVIFNAISNNFSEISKFHKIKIGDTFYSITLHESPTTSIVYYSPKVTEVNDDFFIIAGAMFTETEISDMYAKETEGTYYTASIGFRDNIIVKENKIFFK